MCAHKNHKSQLKKKINQPSLRKHLHQPRMKSKLKKIGNKFKIMSKLKMGVYIKGI
jgi:hypothetical protein